MIERFTVSMPPDLLAALDAAVAEKGYASRSELMRDLIRGEMVEERWQNPDDRVVGVLTVVYDHHQPGLAQRLIDKQHDHLVNVLCTTHVHISHHDCLEVIIMSGEGGRIQGIADSIGGLRGVKFARLTRAAGFQTD